MLAAICGILLAGFSGGPSLDMGAEYLLGSIAVVVIGGQSLSLFLTLIVTPLAFHAVEAVRARSAVRETAPATA